MSSPERLKNSTSHFYEEGGRYGYMDGQKEKPRILLFRPHASGGGGGGSEMKARPLETASGKPGPAGRSGRASFSTGPAPRTTAAGAGPFIPGALGAAVLAAALLLAPETARAGAECGGGNALNLNCAVTDFTNGIVYGIAGDGNNLVGTGVGQTLNLLGSATRPITITAGPLGVAIGGQKTGSTGSTFNIGGATGGTAHVINIVQGTNAHTGADRNNGIYLWQSTNNTGASVDVNVRAGVTIGTMATPMKRHGIFLEPRASSTSQGRGSAGTTLTSAATIYAARQGIRVQRTNGGTNDATTITNTGDIFSGVNNPSATSSRATGSPHERYRDGLPHGIFAFVGGTQMTGSLTVDNDGDITLGGAYTGILMEYWGAGAMSLDNSGNIGAATGQTARQGIQFNYQNWDNPSAQPVTLTNSGAITASEFGIRLMKLSGGNVELTNSGAITVTGDAAQHMGHAIYLTEGVTFGAGGRTYAANGGTITVDNSGALDSKNHALYVYLATADEVVDLTNTGTVLSGEGDGIRIERTVEGDVEVTNSGSVTGKAHGIYIGGKAARIDVDQSGGTIQGRTGVYAQVTRSRTTGGTRSTDSGGDHDPAIDIDWTGGSITRGTATTDNGRFAAASAAQVLTFDQEAEAVKAVAGTVRWGSAAGIEAHALSWRDVVAQVAKGDDPGMLTAGDQTTVVPTGATASDNAYIAQFKTALANMDLDVASAVLTAIGTTATTAVADLTDAQIVAYLRTNNGPTRTLLRNILAQGLSTEEKAVLRAVAAGDSTALTTALADTGAAFSTAYKTAVNALLDRYNLDDIRVSVSGGSIDSHGDGIRAYYATGHDNNGGIDVTIAAGATVSGGVNGILVSGSGTTSTGKNQEVTVAGRVEGGTGAGVHLVGGGTVTVEEHGVVVATSGTAITTSGGGDLTANINAGGRVEGDIRAAGALTLTAAAGSEITGTVYNPTSAFTTVSGSIGRLLYTNGGTMTVASTGALTGVSGQAIRSSAGALAVTVDSGGTVTGNILAAGGGALSADIAGTVNGDIQATGGGALTFTSRAGSRVSGTVHDPTGSLSVAGSIGRLLYTNGGTVSVASGGAITGVAGQTTAIQSNAGALDVTIAGSTTVGGAIHANGGGNLDVDVAGTVGGALLADGGGALDADVSGTVKGDIKTSGTGNGAVTAALTGTGRVEGDIQASGTGTLTLTAAAGSVITGTVHNPTSAFNTVAGSIGRLLYTNGGAVTVASTGTITGVTGETEAIRSTAGALSVVIASGRTVGGAIRANGGGNLDVDVAGTVSGALLADGGGNLDADVSGTVKGDIKTSGTGNGNVTAALTGTGRVEGDIQATGTLTLTAAANSVITGTVHDPTGSLSVAGSIGRLLYTNGGTVSVASTGAITGVTSQTTAIQSSAGALDVTIASGTTVGGAIHANGGGDLDADVAGTVSGALLADGGGNLDADVSGTVKGDIKTSGTGNGNVTAALTGTGRVEGDIQASGTGTVTLTAAAGSVITGTVHDLTSAFNTVDGTIGRLLYTNGGAVTVASTGAITGVRGETEAIRSDAGALSVVIADGRTVGGAIRANGGGDLDVDVAGTVSGALLADGGGNLDADVSGTVKGHIQTSGGNGDVTADIAATGRVEGDIQASGTGTVTLAAAAGSVITGTVDNLTNTFNTVEGTIGRLLYRNGGAVTVVSGGHLTGVDVDGVREALRSKAGDLSVMIAAGTTVGGNIQADGGGDLTADVAGTVGGAIRADGGGNLDADVAGTVKGDIQTSGGNGAVTAALTGTGRVEGDIQASGTGTLTLTAPAGSVITGTVHNPTSAFTTVAGSIGRILYTNGGAVTVAAGGELTGVPEGERREALRSDAGDLSVMIAAGTTVGGDIRGLGDGDLTAEISGWVDGDVVGSGGGEHVVTVPDGGEVTGLVHLGGSTVTVGGIVGGIFLENGGTVTVEGGGMVKGTRGGRPGDYGVRLDNGGTITIETGGTIQSQGKPTILVSSGDLTVKNDGTLKNTGDDGYLLLHGTGAYQVTSGPDSTMSGKVSPPDPDNPNAFFDASNAAPNAIMVRICREEDETCDNPLDSRNYNNITFPGDERGGGGGGGGGGDCTPPPNVLGNCSQRMPMDPSVFALTDDMLSDLTGSIHSAVVDTETALRRGAPTGGRVVWAAPFGGARDQNGRVDVMADATHYFGGGILGMSWGAKDVRVGGFIGGSVGQLAASGKPRVGQDVDVDMQTIFFGLGASRALGPVLYDARLLVGSLTQDSTRSGIPVMDTAEVEYSSVFFSPEVGVATTMTLTDTLEARPRLRVRYAGLFTEGFRERGQTSMFDLQVEERTLHLVEARAEVGIPFALASGGWINPRVGVEGRYLLAGSEIKGMYFGNTPFSLDVGGDAGVITGTVGLGVAVPVAEAMTLVGSFDGALTTERAWRALGYLGLTWSF